MHHRVAKVAGLVVVLVGVAGLSARPPAPGPDKSGKPPDKTGKPTPGEKVRLVVEDFETRVYRGDNGKELPYRLMQPVKDLDPNQMFPMVLILHGVGERGTDNKTPLLRTGIRELFTDKQNRAKYPCYVVLPQCPLNGKWVDVNWNATKHAMREEPTETMRLVMELIASLRKELTIDPQQIYVMGPSMGGFGVWDIICRQVDLFAAAVPVSGGGDESQAPAIAKIPIWAFHGDSDNIVKPDWSRRMIAAIRKTGGDPKYTEYKDTGQGAWAKTLAEPDLLKWLFEQKREKPTTQPTQPAADPATQPAAKSGPPELR